MNIISDIDEHGNKVKTCRIYCDSCKQELRPSTEAKLVVKSPFTYCPKCAVKLNIRG